MMRALLLTATAALLMGSPARAELWLFTPAHEAVFAPGSSTPFAPDALAATMDRAVAAFGNRGDVELAIVGAPETDMALASERFAALISELRDRGSWPPRASRGIARLGSLEVEPDRLRLALETELEGDPDCAPWEVHLTIPEFFGERVLRLPVVREFALPQEARILVTRRPRSRKAPLNSWRPSRRRLASGCRRRRATVCWRTAPALSESMSAALRWSRRLRGFTPLLRRRLLGRLEPARSRASPARPFSLCGRPLPELKRRSL